MHMGAFMNKRIESGWCVALPGAFPLQKNDIFYQDCFRVVYCLAGGFLYHPYWPQFWGASFMANSDYALHLF